MSDNGNGNGHGKRAVLYARCSGDDRGKDGRNLASQLELARQYDLIVTGGSDFHGDKTHAELGSVYVPPEVLIQLKEHITTRQA